MRKMQLPTLPPRILVAQSTPCQAAASQVHEECGNVAGALAVLTNHSAGSLPSLSCISCAVAKCFKCSAAPCRAGRLSLAAWASRLPASRPSSTRSRRETQRCGLRAHHSRAVAHTRARTPAGGRLPLHHHRAQHWHHVFSHKVPLQRAGQGRRVRAAVWHVRGWHPLCARENAGRGGPDPGRVSRAGAWQ